MISATNKSVPVKPRGGLENLQSSKSLVKSVLCRLVVSEGFVKLDVRLTAFQIGASVYCYRCGGGLCVREVVVLPNVCDGAAIGNNVIVVVCEIPVAA